MGDVARRFFAATQGCQLKAKDKDEYTKFNELYEGDQVRAVLIARTWEAPVLLDDTSESRKDQADINNHCHYDRGPKDVP